MLKIRRPLGRLIFNMGIAIPGKTVFLIETAPRDHFVYMRPANKSWRYSVMACCLKVITWTNDDLSKVISRDNNQREILQEIHTSAINYWD